MEFGNVEIWALILVCLFLGWKAFKSNISKK